MHLIVSPNSMFMPWMKACLCNLRVHPGLHCVVAAHGAGQASHLSHQGCCQVSPGQPRRSFCSLYSICNPQLLVSTLFRSVLKRPLNRHYRH